jgi:hypothetical protein
MPRPELATKEQTMSRTAKHDHWLLQQLADAEFAAEFLNAASKDVDPVLVHRQWPVFQESLERFSALSSALWCSRSLWPWTGLRARMSRFKATSSGGNSIPQLAMKLSPPTYLHLLHPGLLFNSRVQSPWR